MVRAMTIGVLCRPASEAVLETLATPAWRPAAHAERSLAGDDPWHALTGSRAPGEQSIEIDHLNSPARPRGIKRA